MSKKGNGAREKDHSVDSYENPIVAFDNGDDSPSGRGSTSSERTLTEIETIGENAKARMRKRLLTIHSRLYKLTGNKIYDVR